MLLLKQTSIKLQYGAGQEPVKRQRVVQQALGTDERTVQMMEYLEEQRAEPPWGAFGNRSIPTLSGERQQR